MAIADLIFAKRKNYLTYLEMGIDILTVLEKDNFILLKDVEIIKKVLSIPELRRILEEKIDTSLKNELIDELIFNFTEWLNLPKRQKSITGEELYRRIPEREYLREMLDGKGAPNSEEAKFAIRRLDYGIVHERMYVFLYWLFRSFQEKMKIWVDREKETVLQLTENERMTKTTIGNGMYVIQPGSRRLDECEKIYYVLTDNCMMRQYYDEFIFTTEKHLVCYNSYCEGSLYQTIYFEYKDTSICFYFSSIKLERITISLYKDELLLLTEEASLQYDEGFGFPSSYIAIERMGYNNDAIEQYEFEMMDFSLEYTLPTNRYRNDKYHFYWNEGGNSYTREILLEEGRTRPLETIKISRNMKKEYSKDSYRWKKPMLITKDNK